MQICIIRSSVFSLLSALQWKENAFFVVWRARFIALFIGILKVIRDFYRCIDFFFLFDCTGMCLLQIGEQIFFIVSRNALALNLSLQ